MYFDFNKDQLLLGNQVLCLFRTGLYIYMTLSLNKKFQTLTPDGHDLLENFVTNTQNFNFLRYSLGTVVPAIHDSPTDTFRTGWMLRPDHDTV